jgi:hypothetical protein
MAIKTELNAICNMCSKIAKTRENTSFKEMCPPEDWYRFIVMTVAQGRDEFWMCADCGLSLLENIRKHGG